MSAAKESPVTPSARSSTGPTTRQACTGSSSAIAPNNPASCGVAASAGFLFEGLERQRLAYDGTRFDVERHARLAPDPLQTPQRPVTITV